MTTELLACVIGDAFRKPRRAVDSRGMMATVMRGDVNRNPRRWSDRSARVSVIEGWHPSQPDRVGYNLLVDGDWIGTFESLTSAAGAAGQHLRPRTRRRARPVELLPYIR